MMRYDAVSHFAPWAAAPIRSANSVQLSYMSKVGGGICGKVIMSRCTGIDRSTRRVIEDLLSRSTHQSTQRVCVTTVQPSRHFPQQEPQARVDAFRQCRICLDPF